MLLPRATSAIIIGPDTIRRGDNRRRAGCGDRLMSPSMRRELSVESLEQMGRSRAVYRFDDDQMGQYCNDALFPIIGEIDLEIGCQ